MSEIVNLPEITITDSTYQRSTSEKDALDHIPNNENDPLNQSTIKVNKKKKSLPFISPIFFFFFLYCITQETMVSRQSYLFKSKRLSIKSFVSRTSNRHSMAISLPIYQNPGTHSIQQTNQTQSKFQFQMLPLP